jgi:hypothetical protein
MLSSYLPDPAEVLSRASPRPPASQLSPGFRLKEQNTVAMVQQSVFALKSEQREKSELIT